jgi:hypothetical protein
MGRKADEGSDLLTADLAKFWQQDEECTSEHGADASVGPADGGRA